MKSYGSRFLAAVLCILLAVSMMPVSAWAEEERTGGSLPDLQEEKTVEAEEPFQKEEGVTETAEEDVSGQEVVIAAEEQPAITEEPEEPAEDSPEAEMIQNAASGTCGENLTWTLSNAGVLTISGTGPMTDFSWTVDENECEVVNTPWFSLTESIKSVVIQYGVTSIGDNAFNAFNNSYYDTALNSVTIAASVTRIGKDAFTYCDLLKSISIPDSVTEIGLGAFSECFSVTSLSIGNGVKTIGNHAFAMCKSLTAVTIPASVTSFGQGAFMGCASLNNLTIGGFSASIGDYAFSECKSLETVTIPDTVTGIGENAFKECTSLSSVTIGAKVTSIGSGLFDGCTSLQAINVKSNNQQYASVDGVLFNKAKTVLIAYPCGKGGGYTVPSGVKTIGAYAFSGAAVLEKVTIPDTVTDIGLHAFGDCAALTEIALPDSVVNLGGGAFSKCSSLTDVSLGSGLKKLGDKVFYACSSLTQITVPSSVTSIGVRTFGSCKALTGVTLENGITEIGMYAFANCTALKDISIPDSVTDIGSNAFNGCKSLKSLTIGSGLDHVGYAAFYKCTALTDVYYVGTKTQWKAVTIEDQNDPLLNASIHYNSIVPPAMVTIEQTSDGIRITWAAVDGATKYKVSRKAAGESWKTLKTTQNTYYTDAKVLLGTKYTYRVQAVNDSMASSACETDTVLFNPFTDLPSDVSYFRAVQWAYNNKIVTGTSQTTFSPAANCTRAQFVLMLWKMHGSPAVSCANPFTDIQSGTKVAKAVLWAYKKGYVNGTTKTTFSPGDPITRGAMIMIFWKIAGKPVVSGMTSPFTDVPSEQIPEGGKLYNALMWAASIKLTTVSGEPFYSTDYCTRAQLTIFLYRFNNKILHLT